MGKITIYQFVCFILFFILDNVSGEALEMVCQDIGDPKLKWEADRERPAKTEGLYYADDGNGGFLYESIQNHNGTIDSAEEMIVRKLKHPITVDDKLEDELELFDFDDDASYDHLKGELVSLHEELDPQTTGICTDHLKRTTYSVNGSQILSKLDFTNNFAPIDAKKVTIDHGHGDYITDVHFTELECHDGMVFATSDKNFIYIIDPEQYNTLAIVNCTNIRRLDIVHAQAMNGLAVLPATYSHECQAIHDLETGRPRKSRADALLDDNEQEKLLGTCFMISGDKWQRFYQTRFVAKENTDALQESFVAPPPLATEAAPTPTQDKGGNTPSPTFKQTGTHQVGTQGSGSPTQTQAPSTSPDGGSGNDLTLAPITGAASPGDNPNNNGGKASTAETDAVLGIVLAMVGVGVLGAFWWYRRQGQGGGGRPGKSTSKSGKKSGLFRYSNLEGEFEREMT